MYDLVIICNIIAFVCNLIACVVWFGIGKKTQGTLSLIASICFLISLILNLVKGF